MVAEDPARVSGSGSDWACPESWVGKVRLLPKTLRIIPGANVSRKEAAFTRPPLEITTNCSGPPVSGTWSAVVHAVPSPSLPLKTTGIVTGTDATFTPQLPFNV